LGSSAHKGSTGVGPISAEGIRAVVIGRGPRSTDTALADRVGLTRGAMLGEIVGVREGTLIVGVTHDRLRLRNLNAETRGEQKRGPDG
jgi:hypothetical protein